jgi:hypothetical protein
MARPRVVPSSPPARANPHPALPRITGRGCRSQTFAASGRATVGWAYSAHRVRRLAPTPKPVSEVRRGYIADAVSHHKSESPRGHFCGAGFQPAIAAWKAAPQQEPPRSWPDGNLRGGFHPSSVALGYGDRVGWAYSAHRVRRLAPIHKPVGEVRPPYTAGIARMLEWRALASFPHSPARSREPHPALPRITGRGCRSQTCAAGEAVDIPRF